MARVPNILTVDALHQFMVALATARGDSCFEVDHLNHVTSFAKEIGEKRGLDLDLCMAIGCAHDIGRLMLGIVGKGHAEAGARLMEEIFKVSTGLPFSKSDQKLIVHAIGVHNQKRKIHGPYDEMIKDADAMAHGVEGDLFDDAEQWRVAACTKPSYRLTVKEIGTWDQVLESEIAALKKHLSHDSSRHENPDEWVHQTRTAIRKVRSIADVVSGVHGSGGPMSPNNAGPSIGGYKKIAKELDAPRFYYVALTMLPQNAPQRKALRKKLDKAYEEIEDRNYRLCPLEVEVSVDSHCHQAIRTYLDGVIGLSLKDQDALHQLRIQGKRILSWIQADLVSLEPPDLVQVIKDIHHHSGKYRDAVLIRKKLGTDALLSMEKHHRKQLKSSLLYLKLFCRRD